MNSQEVIFNIKNANKEALIKIQRINMPLAFIKDNVSEFGVLLHPFLGTLLIEKKSSLKISTSFFPKPSKNEFYYIGRFAKTLTNLGLEYEIFLNQNQKQKLLFSRVVQEHFHAN